MKNFSYHIFLFLFVSVASSNFNIILAQGFTQNYFFGLNLVSYDFDSTSDHGFIVTGSEFGNSGDGDYFLMKLDSNGNSQWHQKGSIYNGLSKSNYCQTVKEDSSGNFIAAGNLYLTSNNVKLLIIKYDDSGNLIWEKEYGNGNYLSAEKIYYHDSFYILIYYDSSVGKSFILYLNNMGDSLSSFPIMASLPSTPPILDESSFFKYAGLNFDSITMKSGWTVSKIDLFGNTYSEYFSPDTTSELALGLLKSSDGTFYILIRNSFTDSLKLNHIDSVGNVFWSLNIPSIQLSTSLTQSSNNIFIGTTGYNFTVDTSGKLINIYEVNAGLIYEGFTRLVWKDSSLFYMGVASTGAGAFWNTVFIKIPESTLSITESFKSDYIKIYYNGKDICISSEVNLGKSSFYIFNIEGELLSYRVLDNELATIENSINRIFINCEINSGIYIGYLDNPKLKLKYAQKLIIY